MHRHLPPRSLSLPAASCLKLLCFEPATISFGQQLNPATLDRAGRAAREADLVVALGSTLSVYPAASFPLLAAARGIAYVIINRGATDHDHEPAVSLRIESEVTEVFPGAVDAALGGSV